MSTIDEKRVYGDRTGATDAYVASGVGVVRVSIAGDIVGEFGLVERCDALDVAASDRTVAVATDEDVLVRALSPERDERDDPEANRDRDARDARGADDARDSRDARAATDEFVETGFGPAVAVGFDGADLLAAGPDGRVARVSGADVDEASSERRHLDWHTLESPSMALEVRSIDGDLVATAEGVCRVHETSLEYVGLSDVRDVSAAGIPLAATDEGLYALGNGWVQSREGSFEVVAADPASDQGSLRRAHAVSGLDVYAHRDGDWLESDRTSVPVADVAYGETVYAVTENGTVLAASTDGDGGSEDAGESASEDGGQGRSQGWRSRSLGVGSVAALAIPLETRLE